MTTMRILAAGLLAAASLLPQSAIAGTETYSVIYGQKTVGHLIADTVGHKTVIDFDYKNNGRGPTMAETIETDDAGIPTRWTVTGSTTFGSKVNESFALAKGKASWTDSTGSDSAAVAAPSLYVSQSGSPWSIGLQARALLKASGQSLPALPGGTLHIEKGQALSVKGDGGATDVAVYTLSGVDLAPTYMLLDGTQALFAYITPDFVVVRKGYEGEEARLRALAEQLSTQRYVDMQKKYAHDYGAPLRIRNVRIFDPKAGALTAPMSVVVSGQHIAAVEALDSPSTPGEVLIDGAGGTLVAGLTDMHAHLGQDDAMLNLVAGITSVRDMGNDNAVLDKLVGSIEAGKIGGPRVVRSGFLEGKSPFSANNGIVVDSEAAAVDAVRWYGARGYWQIKIYNSMNPAWVPAIVSEAHKLGMRVAGHVPAFSNADAMMAAGYDEMTHINQIMLGWVLKPDEDTRTLLRITALKRLPALDLTSAPVRKTIDTMVARKIGIDPTLEIHELALLGRDGSISAGAVDYASHMPVSAQRGLKQQMLDTSASGDDAAYRAAYGKIVDTLRIMHGRGIFIVPGTDLGGAFTLHRELELYQTIGMTPAEILKRDTLDVAAYMGRDQSLGSIEKGKLADFFLIPGDPLKDMKAIKTIAMVVKNGTVYFPTEIYPEFGITPFTTVPKVTMPARNATAALSGQQHGAEKAMDF